MNRIVSSPGFTPGVVGSLLLLQLALVGVFVSATLEDVYFFGQKFDSVCSFKQAIGSPCPTCGMTRSVVLTVHGELGNAISVNPAGPPLVLGVVLFGAAMLLLMRYKQSRAGSSVQVVEKQIKVWTIAYGLLIVMIALAHWLSIIL